MSKLNKILNDKSNKMKKTDWIIAIILCLIFGIFAFYKLGSNINTETYAYFNNNDTVNFELNKVTYVSKMRYFMGSDIGDYSIYYSIDGDDYFYLTGIKREYEFKWYDIYIGSDVKYLKIVSDSDNCYLGEIMLYDKDNNKISISSNDNGKKLIDESYTIPDEISYFNSTYFDEIYFARAAYDYVVGLPASEWTHPPFAKLIQAIPIYLLGMNPFSYRLIGVICGMLLVLVMYYFAKLMFKNRIYAVFAGLLIVFDNFHLVQSRIGTSDSELILFMVLSSLFMYKYLLLNKKETENIYFRFPDYFNNKYISNNNWETFKNKLMKIDRTTIILIAKNTNPITKFSPYEPHYKNLEQQTRKIINEMRISLLYDIFLQYLLPPNDNIFYIVLQNKNGQQFKTSIYQRDGTFIKQVYNKNVNVMKKYYLYFTLICLCITIFSIFFLQWYINNKGSIFNIIDNYHV